AHAKARAHKRTFRKCSLLYLELLQANDVGLCPCEPRREIMQTLVDAVDVESGDLQWSGLRKTPIADAMSNKTRAGVLVRQVATSPKRNYLTSSRSRAF